MNEKYFDELVQNLTQFYLTSAAISKKYGTSELFSILYQMSSLLTMIYDHIPFFDHRKKHLEHFLSEIQKINSMFMTSSDAKMMEE